MTLFLYGFAFCVFIILAGAPYTDFVNSKWYWSLCLLGLFTNGAWLAIAKLAQDHKDIMFRGLYFDLMVTVIYLVLPILFFNVQLTRNNSIGIGLIVVGLIVSKL